MRQKLVFRVLAVAASAALASCASRSASIPLGNWEPEAALVANSTQTPQHSLPRTEYPFDAQGNYIASWAASGERRFESGSGSGSGIDASRTSPESKAMPAARVAKVAPVAQVMPVVSAAPSKPSTRFHKVGASDTLWGLSRKYGTTVAAIQRANGLSDTIIRTGSTIKIPG